MSYYAYHGLWYWKIHCGEQCINRSAVDLWQKLSFVNLMELRELYVGVVYLVHLRAGQGIQEHCFVVILQTSNTMNAGKNSESANMVVLRNWLMLKRTIQQIRSFYSNCRPAHSRQRYVYVLKMRGRLTADRDMYTYLRCGGHSICARDRSWSLLTVTVLSSIRCTLNMLSNNWMNPQPSRQQCCETLPES